MIAKIKYVALLSLLLVGACASSNVVSNGYISPGDEDYKVVRTGKIIYAYNTEQYPWAETLIRELKESDPKWLDSYKYQAKIYSVRKQYDKAFAEIETGMQYCLGAKAQCSLYPMKLNLINLNGGKGFYAKMKDMYNKELKASPEIINSSYEINKAMALGAAKAYSNTKDKKYLDDAYSYCRVTHPDCSCKSLVKEIETGKVKG